MCPLARCSEKFIRGSRHYSHLLSMFVTMYQDTVEPNLAPLMAVLAGATALRSLSMLAHTSLDTFSHCGLLRQLTALEIQPVTNRLDIAQLHDNLWGLTRLQRLRLHFDMGAIA